MSEIDRNLSSIYNAWQRAVFTKCGKPFRYRRDFSDFEKSHATEYASLLKLKSVFSSFPSINADNYFVAPYEVKGDEYGDTVLKLDFYCTPKAVRLYKEYISLLDEKNNGSDDINQYETQKKFIEQMSFVRDFCINNGMDIVDYANKDVGTPELLIHFMQRSVGKWVLCAFFLHGARFDSRLKPMYSDDEMQLMYGRPSVDAWLQGLSDDISPKIKYFLMSAVESVRKRIDETKKTY